MAPLLKEEENYVRLALLLKGVSPRAVRLYFNKEFPPKDLHSMLNTKKNTLSGLKRQRVLNQAQWNLLFPIKGVPDSTTFDVTLMICLIRNLTSVAQPINGFNSLPPSVETTPEADLARIKWYRNILAHHDNNIMATVGFNTAWSNITDAVSRLGGQPMNQECQELKVKSLDQSNQEIMLEIKQLQKEMEELRLAVNNPIPLNIRDQIKEELETWREDDKTFIETNGAKSVLKCIKDNGCVVATGSSGTGKSLLVRHVAFRMQEGYDIVPVTNPEEIIQWHDPSKKILFVVDDFCGTYTINPMKFESWKNLMGKIKTLVEKKLVKLIMSCRLQVYKDEKMKSLSFYQSCECNLLSEDLRLSKTEKQSIAELYLKTKASKIEEFYDMFDCFPLLCQLYSKNTQLKMVDFFQTPFTVYKEEIDKLQTEGAHVKYCALALCVMFNNRFKEEWLTEDVDEDIKTIIKNTYEACKVLKGTSRLVLRDELDSLTHTFIRKDGEVYRTIHDKLFDFLAFYFGIVMINCLIKNASSPFIRERFVFERKTNRDEFLITVSEQYQNMYMERLINDWLRGKVVDVFCNINMHDQIFRQRFLVHIKGLEISQQKKLASLDNTKNKSTPLIQCCYDGDIYLVKWCLYHCITNVDQCRDDGASPLYIACQEGHIEVVQMLMNNKANINKCTDKGASPLFIACEKRRPKVVQMLINNNADINKCTDKGVSPLCIACQEGHTEVVQMLINNTADINKCTDKGTSHLFIACQEGHIEVVQMLIKNKANINKCTYKGASPLFIACEKRRPKVVQMLINNNADINKYTDKGVSPLCITCQEGHIEVVQMLINNNADINKCTDKGVSPLCIACQEGHTEVVQVLINNKADIDKCTDKGVSPLCIACQEGHIEVVQMLINNNANINKCTYKGASPLFIACEKRRPKAVQMLINNNADINKCTDKGVSPLCIACQEGHTEVVQMLINNKAEINKCTDKGASPVLIACEEGHTEVVQMLINNKADINKCTVKGASPMFIACQEGHTEVVQMLINNTADINKCKDTGASPLFIACQEGHTEVVQMLVNNKADITKCMRTGESPLFQACYRGHTEIVELLLKHKADINLKCQGITPVDIARRKHHINIVHILQKQK
ncbi:ankyrin-3-like [Mytilus californianus]|uniref:ankyrin-3-like n=1 Tax=Mytilus californianus TaxID=6549 RepID=UPI002246750B|nr:ankyrin-3-like [Mytilus californianus]